MLSAAAAGGGRNDVVWRDDTAGAIRCSRHVDECIAEVVDAKLQSHRIATTATLLQATHMTVEKCKHHSYHKNQHIIQINQATFATMSGTSGLTAQRFEGKDPAFARLARAWDLDGGVQPPCGARYS